VTTSDGRPVDLATLQVGEERVEGPRPNPPLDSAANDPARGERMSPTRGEPPPPEDFTMPVPPPPAAIEKPVEPALETEEKSEAVTEAADKAPVLEKPAAPEAKQGQGKKGRDR